jgi:hypothetical protein
MRAGPPATRAGPGLPVETVRALIGDVLPSNVMVVAVAEQIRGEHGAGSQSGDQPFVVERTDQPVDEYDRIHRLMPVLGVGHDGATVA